MVVATAGFCCCRGSPVLHTFESMAGRLTPTQGGAFTAAISAGLLKPFSSLRLANFTSPSFFPSWTLSNLGHIGTRRTYCREGDGGRPKSVVAEAYEQYGEPQRQEREGIARPPMVQWEKDLANAVQLIGRVGREVQIKYLDSGKVIATTSLAVRKSSQRNEDPSWFGLEMWDDLAQTAAQHVVKGDQVFVTGRIVIDKRTKDEVAYTNVKVIVRDLFFVNSSSDQRQPYSPSNDKYRSSSQSQAEVTSTGSSQQNWNQQQGSSPPSQAQTGSASSYSDATLATEKNWQEYFADPTQWWDNRGKKRNPKAPDFKHKSTQEALWVDSWNNPPWVEKQLAVLEEMKGEHKGYLDHSGRSQDKNLSSFNDSDLSY